MRKKITGLVTWITLSLGAAALVGLHGVSAQNAAPAAAAARPTYHSPYDVLFSPDGKTIAVSDRTAGAVALIDKASGKVRASAPLTKPGGLAWSADSASVFAVDYQNACVAQISAADAKIARKMPVGFYPTGVAVANKKQVLLVANGPMNDVSLIDLTSGKEKKRVPVVREPFYIAVAPDESMAVVSNLIPAGAASEPTITAAVSIIDIDKMECAANIPLPPNTASIRYTAVSPDGKWAYAVHTVGRTTLPATQLERGWVNTNALSIIDLKARKLFATLLLDNLAEGAADPWGMALSKDGNTMWITLAGIHHLAKVDVVGLLRNLGADATPPATQPAPDKQPKKVYSQATIWQEIKADPSKRADLVNDLSALYVANLMTRTPLPGKAPRGISLSPDGTTLAIGMYYTGNVLLVDPAECKVTATISLGNQPEADDTRNGERIFHDATYSFQHWLSCATCHPNEGRVDGMNWDLPNDGIGNPKNAKSLLYADRTPPMMWLGVRDTMETAAMAGFRFAAYQPAQEDAKCVQAYIRSLTEEKSPYLVNGQLSEKAKRGKVIFEDQATACAHCHKGALLTNGERLNVGTQGPLDHKGEDSFVTPPLVELWRSAPYMHDGRAATLQEIFTKFNPKDEHGKTKHLTREQIDDLVEYLLSL